MNKGDLVGEVAKAISSKKQAQEAVGLYFSTITQTLKKKGVVTLISTGTFKVNRGRREKEEIPRRETGLKSRPGILPKFLTGKALQDAVNSKVSAAQEVFSKPLSGRLSG